MLLEINQGPVFTGQALSPSHSTRRCFRRSDPFDDRLSVQRVAAAQQNSQLLMSDQIKIAAQWTGDLSIGLQPQPAVRPWQTPVLTWPQAAAQGVHRRQTGRLPVGNIRRRLLSRKRKGQPLSQRKPGGGLAGH